METEEGKAGCSVSALSYTGQRRGGRVQPGVLHGGPSAGAGGGKGSHRD